MVGVVSSIPSGGNFIFADFETPRCQFCVKLPEMSNLCYLGKTRLCLTETRFEGRHRPGYVLLHSFSNVVHVKFVSDRSVTLARIYPGRHCQ